MVSRATIIGQANYIVDNNSTVRNAAKALGVAKSTIHKNITQRLEDIDLMLYKQVREVLDKNKAERHIRGGAATSEAYRKRRVKEK